MRTWVVTPTFNERENIDALVGRLLSLDAQVSLVVVDDASPDGTGARVAELARENPRVVLLSRGGKAGLASAYREGFRLALASGAERVELKSTSENNAIYQEAHSANKVLTTKVDKNFVVEAKETISLFCKDFKLENYSC